MVFGIDKKARTAKRIRNFDKLLCYLSQTSMIDEKEFFIDLVNAIPDKTHWSMQSGFSEVYAAMSGIPLIKEPAAIGLIFKNEYRKQIADLAKDNLHEFINFLEVLEGGRKLLEAFDGFVIVTISKDFDINSTILPKYLDRDLLYISDEW